MFLSDKSDLKSLDFKSETPFYKGVRLEWNGLILNGEACSTRPISDMSELPLEQVLQEAYPNLSYIEVCELVWSLQEKQVQFSEQNLFSAFGFNSQQNPAQHLGKLKELPAAVLVWMKQKKVSPQDLAPLKSLQKSLPDSTWDTWLELNPSRSEGKLLLDLLVDIHYLNKPLATATKPKSVEQWMKQLKQIRYPEQSKADQKRDLSEGWPRYAKVQSQRNGDQLQFQMNISFLSLKDLEEKLQRLQQSAFALQEQQGLSPQLAKNSEATH